MRFLLSTLLLALSLLVQAQPGSWRDQDGNFVQDSESMKSRSGFAASILVTTDADWKAKWEKPPESPPSFKRAEDIPYGKPVFILLFFANPKPDLDGTVKVECDLQITSPIGSLSFDQKGMTCFVGHISGSLSNLYLAAPVLAFSGDPDDPPGTWSVQAKLRDKVRNVELPLKYSFNLRR